MLICEIHFFIQILYINDQEVNRVGFNSKEPSNTLPLHDTCSNGPHMWMLPYGNFTGCGNIFVDMGCQSLVHFILMFKGQ